MRRLCSAEEKDEEAPGDGDMHHARIGLAQDLDLDDALF